MKTNSKIVANILACAVWADGVYDEAEKITVEEIAEALQFDSEVFNAEMNAVGNRFGSRYSVGNFR